MKLNTFIESGNPMDYMDERKSNLFGIAAATEAINDYKASQAGQSKPNDLAKPTGPTDEQRNKALNILYLRWGASSVGFMAGLGLSFYRKSGFWGYVGFGLLGSIVIGGLTTVATLPAEKKLMASIK